MTNLSFDSRFNRMWIGIDRLHQQMATIDKLNATDYPRYNIIEDGDRYTLEMALPGWKKDQIHIDHSVQDQTLFIKGTKNKEDARNYVHRGISGKGFTRDFKVGEHIKVVGATFEDGLLTVNLETHLPEELQPRVINIQ